MSYLLEIRNLSISFVQYEKGFRQRKIMPVKDLNLSIKRGEIVAIVGASGSGKSLLAHCILGVLPSNAKVEGEMFYDEKPLTPCMIEKIRGKKIRFIPQSVQHLDPTRKVGKQLEKCFSRPTREKICTLLKSFSLSEEVYDYYPHELSGGMLRRVLFANCTGEKAELIIADEPTPGIHPYALKEILQQLLSFKEEGKSIVFITHDMKSAMEIADRISVFKDGRVVGTASVEEIESLDERLDEYILKLWKAQPSNCFMEVIS